MLARGDLGAGAAGGGSPPLLHRAKAPGGIPRRPKSAWQIFGSDFFKKYKEENRDAPGGIDFAEVYKIQGQAWRDLPDLERGKYEELARQEADKFRRMIQSLQASGALPTSAAAKKKLEKHRAKMKALRKAARGGDDADGDEEDASDASEDVPVDVGSGVTRRADGRLIGPDGKPLSATEAAAFESGYQPRVDRRASHWSQHFKPRTS